MAAVGRVVAERYELGELRGRGGLGQVWSARDRQEDRDVAVKLLHGPDDEPAAELFLREARTAAVLSHPGVVDIYDVGQDTDGTLFLVTELLAGHDLGALGRAGRLAIPRVLAWADGICATLDSAHRAGMNHHNLKPADLFATAADDRIVILDFGLAGWLAAVEATTTRVIGTLAYTAPERLHGQAGDHRADLYSLGCILYELLTGRPPFGTGVPASLVYAHLQHAPEPPERLRPDVPPHVSRLVLDLLAKDPAERPADATVAAARLASTAPTPGRGPSTPPPPSKPPATPAAPVPPAPAAPLPAAPLPPPPSMPQSPYGAPVPPPAPGFGAAPPGPAPVPAPLPVEDDEPRLRAALAAGDPNAAVQLAYHLADLGRAEEAEELYRGALAAGHPEAAQDLADLLAAGGRAVEAEELYRHALAQGHPESANNLAVLLASLGRLPEAEMLYRHALTQGNDEAAGNLALLLAGTGRPDEAEQLLRHAYSRGHLDATINLANLVLSRGRVKEAEKLYRRAFAEGHSDAAIRFAGFLESRGKLREAEEMYRRALAEGHPAAAAQLARFLELTGRAPEAMWLRSSLG